MDEARNDLTQRGKDAFGTLRAVSATPLAWSMAQFIRLATNLKAGRNLETSHVVYDRYVARKTK